jgi:hypothetical protein
MSLQASEVFSATHTGGHSRATHARSHPNTPGRKHILVAKPLELRRQERAPLELRRQERAPRRLAALYKPGGCIDWRCRVPLWGRGRCVPIGRCRQISDRFCVAVVRTRTRINLGRCAGRWKCQSGCPENESFTHHQSPSSCCAVAPVHQRGLRELVRGGPLATMRRFSQFSRGFLNRAINLAATMLAAIRRTESF